MKATLRGLSGGKRNQVIIVSNTRNRSRVCLFLTTENEPFFYIKGDNGKLWVEVIIRAIYTRKNKSRLT